MENVLDLLELSTILIIFGVPRAGKTCLMSHIANEAMFDYNRTRAMQAEVEWLNEKGFNLKIPPNVVSANYDIQGYKYLCSARRNRRINPYRLGVKEYAPQNANLHLDVPYGVYCIQEGQRYLNSRKSANYPDWQSRWYETLGHNHMNVILDCQRPDLIDKNVRELAYFLEIRSLEVKTNRFGDVRGQVWNVRKIPNAQQLDVYLQSGRRDEECFESDVIETNYNVFNIYNSYSCKARFYKGREKESFEFYADVEDELPTWFYAPEKGTKKC